MLKLHFVLMSNITKCNVIAYNFFLSSNEVEKLQLKSPSLLRPLMLQRWCVSFMSAMMSSVAMKKHSNFQITIFLILLQNSLSLMIINQRKFTIYQTLATLYRRTGRNILLMTAAQKSVTSVNSQTSPYLCYLLFMLFRKHKWIQSTLHDSIKMGKTH